MPASYFDTRAALLESGKAEFLRRGFKDASLREICSKAKVTTGALYSNFKDKHDLFCSIVEDDLQAYNEMYDSLLDRAVAHQPPTSNGDLYMMEFVTDHRDLFRLLFDCAQGTDYEGFKAELLDKFDCTYQEFLDSYAPEPVDPVVVRTIVRMKFAQYCEMIYGNYSREKVMEVTERIGRFTRAGFESLLDTKFESPG